MKVSAVIPAAGRGSRMGTEKNKQFLTLRGLPILARTIKKFQQAKVVDEIIIVAHKDEIDYCQQAVVEKYKLDKVTQIVAGGNTRQESVYNGLCEVGGEVDYVLVHDGARPLLEIELIEELVEEVKQFKAAIVGVPIKDTIKKVNQNQIIEKTPDRSSLAAVQTPQAFERQLILDAYYCAQKEEIEGTDSSSLVEEMGEEVRLVCGSYENLKITTPEDLEFADKILEMRS